MPFRSKQSVFDALRSVVPLEAERGSFDAAPPRGLAGADFGPVPARSSRKTRSPRSEGPSDARRRSAAGTGWTAPGSRTRRASPFPAIRRTRPPAGGLRRRGAAAPGAAPPRRRRPRSARRGRPRGRATASLSRETCATASWSSRRRPSRRRRPRSPSPRPRGAARTRGRPRRLRGNRPLDSCAQRAVATVKP